MAANPEDARIGVSRPQIKKYVEDHSSIPYDSLVKTYRYVEKKYKLEIGAAQTTQLSKAITSGTDKGVFVLPKGMHRHYFL